jgi:hypothetical protein
MHKALQDNNYLVLQQFLPPADREALENVFLAFVRSTQPPADDQVENAPAVYNFLPLVELLCLTASVLSGVVAEPLLPTYCYARAYRHGNMLPRHRDRETCEISLSLNLGGDAVWPLFVQKPNGEEVAVNLAPGDGLMYLGCVADHWREPFQGTRCTQAFFHYVRSRGPYGYLYFDRQPPAGQPPAPDKSSVPPPRDD